MDRDEALTHVQRILGASVVALLSTEDLNEALDASLTFDTEHRRPGDAGYVDSYDPHWAAAEAVTTLAVRALGTAGITEWSSEGSTFKKTAADWQGMARALRSRSPLSAQFGGQLGTIDITPEPTYVPRSAEFTGHHRGVIGNWS